MVTMLYILYVCFPPCCTGAPADQQASEGYGMDGTRLPPKAQAHHASAGDSIRAGKM